MLTPISRTSFFAGAGTSVIEVVVEGRSLFNFFICGGAVQKKRKVNQSCRCRRPRFDFFACQNETFRYVIKTNLLVILLVFSSRFLGCRSFPGVRGFPECHLSTRTTPPLVKHCDHSGVKPTSVKSFRRQQNVNSWLSVMRMFSM